MDTQPPCIGDSEESKIVAVFLRLPAGPAPYHAKETNSNFSVNLPWWDRLFGTYRAQPRDGHPNMVVGITQFRTERDLRLDQMLIQPLRETNETYPINERER